MEEELIENEEVKMNDENINYEGDEPCEDIEAATETRIVKGKVKGNFASNDTNDTDYKYYQSVGNKRYAPINEIVTIPELEKGLYSIKYVERVGYTFQREEFQTDKIHSLPIKELESIKSDISKFWEKEEKFKEYGLIHKRGILLYGPPGCGKSCAIQLIMNNLIEVHEGLVFKISNAEDLSEFIDNFGPKLREIEPNRKVLAIIEDIDGLFETGKSVQTRLLNLLDGINQSNNIVYLATTNYPERLEKRILDRPSRFDKRYEFSYPNAEIRKAYLTNSLKKKDLDNINIENWVDASEGLSLAHLRELIVSVIILGNEFLTEIDTLKAMGNNVSSSTSSGTGFKQKGK